MAFCEEHSRVMMALGSLERGQTDIKTSLDSIDKKLETISTKQVDVRISAAQEQVKSRLLYWVIGIAAAALITGLINFTFHIRESQHNNSKVYGTELGKGN